MATGGATGSFPEIFAVNVASCEFQAECPSGTLPGTRPGYPGRAPGRVANLKNLTAKTSRRTQNFTRRFFTRRFRFLGFHQQCFFSGLSAPLGVQSGPKMWPRGPARERRSIVRIRPMAARLVAKMRFGKICVLHPRYTIRAVQ